MKKTVLLFALCFLINSCTGGKVLDIKSPCVSNDDGPCGPKKSVNGWWLEQQKHNS